MGQFGADWLEGKSIPQAMGTLPIALTTANLAQYEADLKDPASVYADPARRGAYLTMWQHLLRDARLPREIPLVVRAEIAGSYLVDVRTQ
jgi:ribose transport system substrate-binding protein